MRSEKSKELYQIMIEKGYPEELAKEITTKYLNTDYTAQRMIGYLYHWKHPRVEDVVDEMLAILSDRERFRQKHEAEQAQAKMNEIYNRGF